MTVEFFVARVERVSDVTRHVVPNKSNSFDLTVLVFFKIAGLGKRMQPQAIVGKLRVEPEVNDGCQNLSDSKHARTLQNQNTVFRSFRQIEEEIEGQHSCFLNFLFVNDLLCIDIAQFALTTILPRLYESAECPGLLV